MKKFFSSLVAILLLIACTPNEIKQTKDPISQANEIFKNASEGLKNLDSISKEVMKDSTKLKELSPKLEKHQKTIENILKNKSYNLDSISSVIDNINKNISKNTDLAKSVDSVKNTLQNSNNPLEMISTITKAIDKVSISNPKELLKENTPQKPQTSTEKITKTQPLIKNTKLTFSVDNLSNNREILKTLLNKHNAYIISESIGEEEGIREQIIISQIPCQYVDETTKILSERIENLKTKNTEPLGKQYNPEQLCLLEITLVENYKYDNNELIENKALSNNLNYKEETFNAFLEGFQGMQSVFLFLLPFWPILLFGGIIYYFYRKNKRMKEKKSKVPTLLQEVNTSKPELTAESSIEKDIYEKYKPKK